MTHEYIPGRGYTVRDARGRILGHSLSRTERDALLNCNGLVAIPATMLPIFAQ